MRRVARGAQLVVVAILLVACSGQAGIPANIEGFSTTADPRVIIVSFTSGRCDDVTPLKVNETDDAVEVTVFITAAPPEQRCDSIAPLGHREQVTLQKDLGSRSVRGPKQGYDAPLIPLTPAP